MGNQLDLTGQTFGHLTALEKTNKRCRGLVVWKFKCDCGNIVELPGSPVKSGNTTSCGCQKARGLQEYNLKQKTIRPGYKSGKLTVIKDLGYYPYSQGRKRTKFLCQCECGNTTEAWSHQLSSGTKISCGCTSSKGEMKIAQLLIKNNISYEHNKVFELLEKETGRKLRFDFIIYNDDNSINRFIEFDGRQHKYGPDKGYWSRTTDTLEDILERDNIKNQFCLKHGYVLVRIPYYYLDSLKFEDLMSDKFIVKGDD